MSVDKKRERRIISVFRVSFLRLYIEKLCFTYSYIKVVSSNQWLDAISAICIRRTRGVASQAL